MTNNRSDRRNAELLLGLAMDFASELPLKSLPRIRAQLEHEAPEPMRVLHTIDMPKGDVISSIIAISTDTLLCTTHSFPQKAYLFSEARGLYCETILSGQTCGAFSAGDRICITLYHGGLGIYDHRLHHLATLDAAGLFPEEGQAIIASGTILDCGLIALCMRGRRGFLGLVRLTADGLHRVGKIDDHCLRNANYAWATEDRLLVTTNLPYSLIEQRVDTEGRAWFAGLRLLPTFPVNVVGRGKNIIVTSKSRITTFDAEFRRRGYATAAPSLAGKDCTWPFVAFLAKDAANEYWIAAREGNTLFKTVLDSPEQGE